MSSKPVVPRELANRDVYVAATRARKELLVLSYGVPSPLLHRD